MSWDCTTRSSSRYQCRSLLFWRYIGIKSFSTLSSDRAPCVLWVFGLSRNTAVFFYFVGKKEFSVQLFAFCLWSQRPIEDGMPHLVVWSPLIIFTKEEQQDWSVSEEGTTIKFCLERDSVRHSTKAPQIWIRIFIFNPKSCIFEYFLHNCCCSAGSWEISWNVDYYVINELVSLLVIPRLVKEEQYQNQRSLVYGKTNLQISKMFSLGF